MTVRTALLQGTRLLNDSGVGAPRLTAEVLLGHALGCERVRLFSHPEQELGQNAWLHYGRYLFERMKGKPTQYITKNQEFFGRTFRVGPEVLIPRPETELVVEAALARLSAGQRVIDVGVGSGAIAVTLALELGCRVTATDISAAALAVASVNACVLNASVDLVRCDVLSAFASGSADAIVSNPPYIPEPERSSLQREVRDFEPALALFAGPSGLDVYKRLIADAARVLRPSGWLIVELGHGSLDGVKALLNSSWRDLDVTPDGAGIPRVLAARRAP